MPQLDKVTFLSQFFWLCIVFVSLYLILVKNFLPKLARIVKVRQALVLENNQLVQARLNEKSEGEETHNVVVGEEFATLCDRSTYSLVDYADKLKMIKSDGLILWKLSESPFYNRLAAISSNPGLISERKLPSNSEFSYFRFLENMKSEKHDLKEEPKGEMKAEKKAEKKTDKKKFKGSK
jgi:hypothetical protein